MVATRVHEIDSLRITPQQGAGFALQLLYDLVLSLSLSDHLSSYVVAVVDDDDVRSNEFEISRFAFLMLIR